MSRKKSLSRSQGTLFTVGFSTHRVEGLELLRREMLTHEAIVLEEPPSTTCGAMLRGEAGVEDYLMELDSAFPEFSRRQAFLLQEMYRAGKDILQIEPFWERLMAIHELLAQGRTPAEISVNPEFQEVYESEKEATGALLDFYGKSLTADFSQVVEAVIIFARADAGRFRLRDRLRAQALAGLADKYGTVLVEAGNMHQGLVGALGWELGGSGRVRSRFLLPPMQFPAGQRSSTFGPGDRLTLKYILGKPVREEEEKLLAARSLIYIKLLSKEELLPGQVPAPHREEEFQADMVVSQLTCEDCQRLYGVIKTARPPEAWMRLRQYLAWNRGDDRKTLLPC